MKGIKGLLSIVMAIAIVLSCTPVAYGDTGTSHGVIDERIEKILQSSSQFILDTFNIPSTWKYTNSINLGTKKKPNYKSVYPNTAMGSWLNGIFGSTISYGNPSSEEDKKGQPRYLGYTVGKDQYTNPWFTNDVNEAWTFKGEYQKLVDASKKNLTETTKAMGWIYRPWDKGDKKGIVVAKDSKEATVPKALNNLFDDKFKSDIAREEFNVLIKTGIWRMYVDQGQVFGTHSRLKEYVKPGEEAAYKACTTDTARNKILETIKNRFLEDKGLDLTNVAHIMQLPDQNNYGMARMWHRTSNGLRYITIPIAPYEKLEYAVVSSGFLDDDTTATVDFIGKENNLTGAVDKLTTVMTNFYAYVVSTGKSGEELKADMNAYYNNLKGEDKAVFDEAKDLFIGVFKDDPEAEYCMAEYAIFANPTHTVVSELSKMWEVPADATQSAMAQFKDEDKRDLSIYALQYIYNNHLEDKYLVGYGDYDSSVLYTGTDRIIGNSYYGITKGSDNALLNQVGADKNFATKIYNKDYGAIGYIITPVTVEASKLPKSLLKQVIREYTKDLMAEAKNASINNVSDTQSIKNILDKWNSTWASWSDLQSIIHNKLFIVSSNKNNVYGSYDSASNGFKSIKINESGAVDLLNTIIFLSSVDETNKTFKDESGKPIQIKDIMADSDYWIFGDKGKVNVALQKILDNGDYSTGASSMAKSTVESVTRVAAAEAGFQGTCNILTESQTNHTLRIDGNAGAAVVLYDKAIPLDMIMVAKTKEGKTRYLGTVKDIANAVPNYQREFKLGSTYEVPTSNGTKITVKVKQAIIKPAYENTESFIDKIDAANGSGYITVGNTRTNFKAIAATGTTTLDYSLTDADASAYYTDKINNRPAIVVYVEEGNSEIQQVDVVERADGTTKSVKFGKAKISGNHVIITEPANAQLKDWVISDEETKPFTAALTWNDVRKIRAGSTGTSKSNIIVDPESTDIVYVRYTEDAAPTNLSGDLTISQKRITKAVSLSNIGNLATFTFKYDSAGSHEHKVQNGTDPITKQPQYSYPDYDRKTSVDSSYKYVIGHSNTLNHLLISTLGKFIPTYNKTNIKSGTALWNGGSGTVTPNMYFTIWRGKDIPTLASYKTTTSNPLLALGLKRGKTPETVRNAVGGYTDTLKVDLAKASGDYTTSFTDGDSSATQTHKTSDTANYSATVAIHSYIGRHNTADAISSYITSRFKIGSAYTTKAKGYAITNNNLIKFYPYVQMAYDLPMHIGGTQYVDVLAAHESSIRPVDYVDIGWVNNNPGNSLTMSSNQWSTHARAVSNWGRNSVLPGGAIYALNTKSHTSKLAVVTWQNYIPANELPNVTAGSSYYTYNNTISRDASLNSDVIKSIEGLDVVQYLEDNPHSANAFSGVKLNPLGNQSVYGKTTSTSGKYWLRGGTSANRANEGDLDIIDTSTSRIFYKVSADTTGNIIVWKSYNGTSWAELDKISKSHTAASLTKAEAIELDEKTKLVTHFVEALDRNLGTDPEFGNGWYNEAWDGIQVCRTETVHDVGFKEPSTRSVAIDPKITPTKSSQSDLFTKAYLSQFRLNNKSNIRSGEPDGYVGSFEGKDIILPDMADMYVSRKFYIPNATVQDLIN